MNLIAPPSSHERRSYCVSLNVTSCYGTGSDSLHRRSRTYLSIWHMYPRESPQFLIGNGSARHMSPIECPLAFGDPPLTSPVPNGILNGSSDLAGFTAVTDRQTNRHIVLATLSVAVRRFLMLCMRCGPKCGMHICHEIIRLSDERHFTRQSKQWVDGSWVSGSNGSVFGWVIWVMGRCTFSHDPPAYLPEACS